MNSLYTAMEERLFLDDGVMRAIPLVSLFGAANSIHQLQAEALAPLLDRFIFRIEVDWLQSDASFLEYISRKASGDAPVLTVALNLKEIQQLQKECQHVPFPKEAIEALTELKKKLAGEGIFASDRRWGYIVDVLKAGAFMNGDSFVTTEAFQVLRHVLWTDRKQIPVISKLLMQALEQGLPAHIRTLLKTVEGQVQQTLSNRDASLLSGQAALTLGSLRGLRNQLLSLTNTSSVQSHLDDVQQSIQKIENHCQSICSL